MWKYSGPLDPDHALPEELLHDEVWSCLDRVLQLRPKENIDGKLGPLNSSVVSKLVCSPLFTSCSFPLLFSCFFILSRLFCRDLRLTSPNRTFRRSQTARLGRPPKRRRRMPGRRRKPRRFGGSMRRRRRLPDA